MAIVNTFLSVYMENTLYITLDFHFDRLSQITKSNLIGSPDEGV